MSRTVPEEALARLLTDAGLPFAEQQKMAGHRIDFLVDGWMLLDVSGDRWHSWKKIVDCDRLKLERVGRAGLVPCGLWWSRLQRSPDQVAEAVRAYLGGARWRWWDWRVGVEELSSEAQAVIRKGIEV